jgi:hypothetical protein
MAAKKPSKELLALLADRDAAVVELYLGLRALVLKVAPAARETVYDAGYTVSDIFSFTDRWQDSFCMISCHARHVNLVFTWGARLADPERKLQGKGKQMRHLQVRTAEELQGEDLRHFLAAAITRAQQEPPRSEESDGAS